MTQQPNKQNRSKEQPRQVRSKNVRSSAPADHVTDPPKMNVTRIDVGATRIDREPNYVTKVGLGNLKVINANGYRNNV